MKAIAQKEIVSLIADLNDFAERADTMIRKMNAENDQARARAEARQKRERNELDRNFREAVESLKNQAANTMQGARQIRTEINQLDERLSRSDSYYQRTKKKKEAELAGTVSPKYTDATDYFRAFDDIRREYRRLYRKYTEDILPGLLNGLNYLFSAQRRQDYEELISLRNTVSIFANEIQTSLPSMTNERLRSLGEDYSDACSRADAQAQAENAALEQNCSVRLDNLAGTICDELDHILPDEFVEYLRLLKAVYAKTVGRVNSAGEVPNGILNLAFLDYPVTELVENRIVASLVMEKCASLREGDVIRFPIAMSVEDAPAWMILNDNSGATAVQRLVHSIMFGLLSSCPVAALTYSIVDPENRGNSVEPFFDAKKKLPELFGDKIMISPDEISRKVEQLNRKIEDLLQNRLGSQHPTIFDYSRANPEFPLNLELLLLFDFPRGFDERTLAALRNILRNGARCGIYAVISFGPEPDSSWSREYQKNLQSIQELSIPIQQQDQMFLYRGLPLIYYLMPERDIFAGFFSRYMLICEGIRNRGIAFSPLIRKLMDAGSTGGVEEQIRAIGRMMEEYRQAYGRVPALHAAFPERITLGQVLYPTDLFSESPGYSQIRRAFGHQQSKRSENGDQVELPLSFDLGNSFNLFLNCPEDEKDAMLRLTHHLIWSFLSFVPVTRTNICIFDNKQRGNSVIPFLDFRRRSTDTFDGKIHTGTEEMRDRLRSLNGRIDEFIQEKLGNRYRDILEYNLHTPSRAESLTLLLIYDFPSGMDAACLDLLTNILRNGNRCGVYTVICYNPSVPFSRYENIEDRLPQMEKYCASVGSRDGKYELLPYNLPISIPDLPDREAQESFVEDYLERTEQIRKQGLSFRDILPKDLFCGDTSKCLKIPVGVGDGDSIVHLTLGVGSSHHGLIAGATGSGKSTLLHTLIMSTMLTYSPDQVHLYLMDFKSGTEFKVYETVRLPHVQLLALDAMQEFGESILENLVEEMERRGKLFKDAGQTSLKGYVQATGLPMPRILVIMDEFQILFNDATNRKVALNCAELTKRIVTEGRAFGIHLLMATQSTRVISDLTLSHGTVEQMRIRIGLKCGESDARYLFSDGNDARALSMMKGPIGTAVMNPDYTEQGNIGFRAAYCDDATQKEYLNVISARFVDAPYQLQTFEGGRSTPLFDYFREAGIGRTDELPVRIHLGSLIKVAPPFAESIDKKRKHNLLICGANEKMAAGIAEIYILSALLNSHSEVFCMDGNTLVGDDTETAFYQAVESSPAGQRFHLSRGRADIIRFIREIYGKYDAWRKQNTDDTVFVIIRNLQFLDLVRTMLKGNSIDESEFLEEAPVPEPAVDELNPFAAVTSMFAARSSRSEDGGSTGEKLLKLIADGSGFGIHFVVSSLEYQTVKECMYYGENVLNRFPERIVFSLSPNEAEALIENVSIAGLRDNTVYYTDGVRQKFQMKPYVPPTADEIRSCGFSDHSFRVAGGASPRPSEQVVQNRNEENAEHLTEAPGRKRRSGRRIPDRVGTE